MKLNNRGWGLQMMLVLVLLLMLVLIVVSISADKLIDSLNVNLEDDSINKDITEDIIEEEIINPEEINKTYEDLEKEVITATIEYQHKNYKTLVEGEKITVTIKNLKQEDLIVEVNDIEDNTPCTGYGVFKLKNGNVTYNSYLKCSNYITNGYNEIYDVD